MQLGWVGRGRAEGGDPSVMPAAGKRSVGSAAARGARHRLQRLQRRRAERGASLYLLCGMGWRVGRAERAALLFMFSLCALTPWLIVDTTSAAHKRLRLLAGLVEVARLLQLVVDPLLEQVLSLLQRVLLLLHVVNHVYHARLLVSRRRLRRAVTALLSATEELLEHGGRCAGLNALLRPLPTHRAFRSPLRAGSRPGRVLRTALRCGDSPRGDREQERGRAAPGDLAARQTGSVGTRRRATAGGRGGGGSRTRLRSSSAAGVGRRPRGVAAPAARRKPGWRSASAAAAGGKVSKGGAAAAAWGAPRARGARARQRSGSRRTEVSGCMPPCQTAPVRMGKKARQGASAAVGASRSTGGNVARVAVRIAAGAARTGMPRRNAPSCAAATAAECGCRAC
eukprot:45383-Chlamydomonas_euryale.AAC.1